jgi:hypothetical protein
MQNQWTTVVTEKANYERSELGRVIQGTYGKSYVENDEGDEVKIEPRIVRGRGRPRNEDNGTGHCYEFSEDLKCLQILWS